MTSSDDGLSVLLDWKTKGTSLAVLRTGARLVSATEAIGGSIEAELDRARIVSMAEDVLTLHFVEFPEFEKSFTFSRVGLMEKVPHIDRKVFTKAVMLSGGAERVILLELSAK